MGAACCARQTGDALRGWLVGLAVAGLVGIGGVQAQTYLGFRLLDFGGIYVRWGAAAEPVIVTYAFVTADTQFADARNCSAMVPLDKLLEASRLGSDAFFTEVTAAFEMWERVANIRFEPAKPGSKPGILIGAQRDPIGHAYADVAYARSGNARVRPIERSLICLNPAKRWKIGFDGNLAVYDVRYTIAHEIGHAIGLDHPEPHGQLMSMRYQERFRTLQAGDVSGAVRIYGNPATRVQ